MSDETCPHGVLHPVAVFSFTSKPTYPRPYRIELRDSRDCPRCLRDRVESLRDVVRGLLALSSPPKAQSAEVAALLDKWFELERTHRL